MKKNRAYRLDESMQKIEPLLQQEEKALAGGFITLEPTAKQLRGEVQATNVGYCTGTQEMDTNVGYCTK